MHAHILVQSKKGNGITIEISSRGITDSRLEFIKITNSVWIRDVRDRDRDQKNYTLQGPGPGQGPKEKLYRDQNRDR